MFLVLQTLAGCASHQDLKSLRDASKQQPTNAMAQLDYLRERNLQVNLLLDQAEQLRQAQKLDEAERQVQSALAFDPSSERARRIAAAIQLDRRSLVMLQEADRMMKRGSYARAAERVHEVLTINPTSELALQMLGDIEEKRRLQRAEKEDKVSTSSIMSKPVSLQFRDANLRMVFEALSRTSGLNVILDRDVRTDLKTTIFVTNAPLQDVVDLILMQNQLGKKVLNANSLFVYPDSPTKRQEYQELKVRTFQLTNIDAKQIQSLLKSLLKTKEVVVDEHANTVTIRDTPDAIRVAEQMITAQDLPDPEVMLEVQVLEVSHDRLTDLGISWPSSFSLSTPSSASTMGALRKLRIGDLNASGLSLGANFKLTDTDANLLASPRIRARNKEKAKILIGDKVPVISNSSTPSTSGPSFAQTIQYLDVGIKLEVEPQIYRDNDVGIKLNLEVSNITKTISSNDTQTGLSSLAYQIGTRSASTSLRLKDGETQVLGGLISDEDRTTADKVPGLGQLPILGHLFSDHNGDHGKTEIVLQITPHIVRPQLSADADMQELWSGTDSNIRTEQLQLDTDGSSVTASQPGNVGGGTSGAALKRDNVPGNTANAVPPTGAFGQPAPAPRTTPPPVPYGGRFSTTPLPPPTPVAPAAPAAADAAAATNGPPDAAVSPAQAPNPAPAPAPEPAAAPATPSGMPPAGMPTMPSDIPSDNPLHPIGG
ncbi:type IV pilus secretin PilQ [Vogesella sp. LIG4]|uniref:type IV pilus secretin PilQ n=1 Tax=Vogesella sp. LIG4 TaxID=1192162 RepID=UPI0018D2B875|nr:type IV pilus secretin PilQ [Vogesella sp. LIG4]